MMLWLRIAVIVALAILLWILVVDLTKSVDGGNGALGRPGRAASLAAHVAPLGSDA